MKALIIGSGGREHAIAWKLAQSSSVSAVYVTPGNPGCAQVGECIAPPSDDPKGYLAVAEGIDADFTVVGPEAPLVAGIVDTFRARGRRIVGPTAAAAQLEGSKVFSKEFMKRSGVPTALALTVESKEAARACLSNSSFPLVIKYDGLAAGKGVVVCPAERDAVAALASLPSGRYLLEEFLTGEEVSFIVYVHESGKIVGLEATQDHKAIYDDDKGPNTGGMGAYSDGRILNADQAGVVMDTIIEPVVCAMKRAGTPYSGFLYAGLMMTDAGPKVIEFNARLGDPEAQALMQRMNSDLAATLLDAEPMTWKPDPSVCVVLAAHGYPGTPRKGDVIHGLDSDNAMIFQAGTRSTDGQIVTSGGRVLGITASGPTLPAAIDKTYKAVRQIHFDGMQYRTDIGKKGLRRW
jgi:phosphoribosylamine--glycine ligase